MKLSPTSRKLVEAFDSAAHYYGWQEEQGVGSTVRKARDEYIDTKDALVDRIAKLERDAKRFWSSRRAGHSGRNA